MDITKSKLKKVISLLIVISPILNIYKMESLPLSFGDFAVCIVIVLSIIANSANKYVIKKENISFLSVYCVFFVTTIISIIIQGGELNTSDFFSKWSRLLIYGILLDIVVPKDIKLEFIKKWLIRLSVLLSISLIIQEILKSIGIIILPYLDDISLNYNVSADELIQNINRRQSLGLWRVSSIFPEPAHFSYFALAGLIVILFGKELYQMKKIDYIFSGLITVSLLICGSAIGYFTAGALWIIWLFYNFREKIAVRRLLGLFVIILIATILFLRTGTLEKALYRLGTVSSYSEGATGGIRLLQGIYVYMQMNIVEQFIGVGFGNVSYFLVQNSITTPFLSEIGNEYMNVFSNVLVSGGIIGFIFYILLWFKLWKKNKSVLSRISWFVLTVLACTSSIFYSCSMILFITLILCKAEYDRRYL